MKTERIYLASSWRNDYQPHLIMWLRQRKFEVYDFRDPRSGGPQEPLPAAQGFSWKDVEGAYRDPDPRLHLRRILAHEISRHGFESDFNAMKWADTCLLVLPSGRSAHLEAGWMSGAGKKLIVHMPDVLCTHCNGTGRYLHTHEGGFDTCLHCTKGLTWSFEPELMYLIGGSPEVITTNEDEIMARLLGDPERIAA